MKAKKTERVRIERIPSDDTARSMILIALERWANQRAGMNPRDYGSWNDYRAESRRVTRQLHDFRRLFAAVERASTINADALRAAFRAFSGRLQLHEYAQQFTPETCPGNPCSADCDHRGNWAVALDYCTGQYFATEYRAAACAVLASALWDYYRAHCMPAPLPHAPIGFPTNAVLYTWNGASKRPAFVSAGEWLRRKFRREFGAHIQKRWFD